MQTAHYELDARLADTHWWWVARRKIITHLMDRFAGQERGRRILEVGCSTGSNLPMLQRYGSVQAMEMNGPAVDICRQRHPDIPVRRAAIPAALDDSFDIICLFDVLEHIEDDAAALEWLDGHLVSGGKVFFTVPAFPFLWSGHDVRAHHYRRYRRSGLQELLSRTFDVRYVTHFNTHLFPGIAVERLARRLFALSDGETDKEFAGTGIPNRVLETVFAAERMWLPGLNLPFGVSLFAYAHKSGSA